MVGEGSTGWLRGSEPVSAATASSGVRIAAGGVGREVEQDAHQRGPVGDRVVEAQHDRTEVVAGQHVGVPQRPVAGQRLGHPGLEVGAHRLAPAVALEPVVGDVPVDVEVGILDPVVEPDVGVLGAPREHRVALDHALAQGAGHGRGLERLVEPHHPLDHHQVLGAVHVQPEGVVRGQGDACGHGPIVPSSGGGVTPWSACRRAGYSAGARASSSSISAVYAATRLAMSGTAFTSVLKPTRISSL